MTARDETVTPDEEGERYDAPNQQVVREDGSGPADEGSGGPPAEPEPVPEAPEPPAEPEPDTE